MKEGQRCSTSEGWRERETKRVKWVHRASKYITAVCVCVMSVSVLCILLRMKRPEKIDAVILMRCLISWREKGGREREKKRFRGREGEKKGEVFRVSGPLSMNSGHPAFSSTSFETVCVFFSSSGKSFKQTNRSALNWSLTWLTSGTRCTSIYRHDDEGER